MYSDLFWSSIITYSAEKDFSTFQLFQDRSGLIFSLILFVISYWLDPAMKYFILGMHIRSAKCYILEHMNPYKKADFKKKNPGIQHVPLTKLHIHTNEHPHYSIYFTIPTLFCRVFAEIILCLVRCNPVSYFNKQHMYTCQLKEGENTLFQKQTPAKQIRCLIPHLSSFKIHIWTIILG